MSEGDDGLMKARLSHIQSEIPEGVRLVAVSKFQPLEALRAVYAAGHRDFGENRVQELVKKAEVLPEDIRWHLVGHLQRNKVRAVLPHVWMVHSLDSFRLAKSLDEEAERQGLRVRCLVQVHIAQEASKYGFAVESLREHFRERAFSGYKHLDVVGLMGMATNIRDEAQCRREFGVLRELRSWVHSEGLAPHDSFDELSMGMSQDWRWAVAEGSTWIRLGRAVFEGGAF